MDESEYVRLRLDDQIDWHERKAAGNRSWFRRLRMFEIVFAAVIPMVSIAMPEAFHPRLVVSTIGVAIALISGTLALYRFQENWAEYRSTAESLRQEKFLFLTRAGDYTGPEPFRTLVERVEAALARQTGQWAAGTSRGAKRIADIVSIERR